MKHCVTTVALYISAERRKDERLFRVNGHSIAQERAMCMHEAQETKTVAESSGTRYLNSTTSIL